MILDGGKMAIYNVVINDDVLCMDFNPSNDRYPESLVQSSFDREVSYLLKLQKYRWAPEVIDLDYATRKIYIKWYNNTCENVLPDDWEIQLEQIAQDLHAEQIYKPSFYSKYFYVDINNIIRSYNFYSASDYSEQPIEMEFYKPILNEDRLRLVEQLSVDGKLDMKILIERAFNDYIKWPGNPLPKIYSRVYE
jgi:hypothetical protein